MKWSASLAGVVAALMVAVNAGAKITGIGFVIFIFSSLCWLGASFLDEEGPLGVQNVALLGINIFGAYRYLVVKRRDA